MPFNYQSLPRNYFADTFERCAAHEIRVARERDLSSDTEYEILALVLGDCETVLMSWLNGMYRSQPSPGQPIMKSLRLPLEHSSYEDIRLAMEPHISAAINVLPSSHFHQFAIFVKQYGYGQEIEIRFMISTNGLHLDSDYYRSWLGLYYPQRRSNA